MEKYNEAKEAIAKIEALVTMLDLLPQGTSVSSLVGTILTEADVEAISQLLQMDVSGMTVGMVKVALNAAKDSMNAALEAMGGEEGYAALESQNLPIWLIKRSVKWIVGL